MLLSIQLKWILKLKNINAARLLSFSATSILSLTEKLKTHNQEYVEFVKDLKIISVVIIMWITIYIIKLLVQFCFDSLYTFWHVILPQAFFPH